MKRVVIESPFAGDVERNLRYVRAAMKDCLMRGEAPFASHALYTQEGVLDDTKPEERKLGMEAGFHFSEVCDLTVIYTDLGMSSGMLEGIRRSVEAGRPFEERKLGLDWDLKIWTREKEVAELYKDLARYSEADQLDAYNAALKELRALQNEEVEEMRKSDAVCQAAKEAEHIIVELNMTEPLAVDDLLPPIEALKTADNFKAWKYKNYTKDGMLKLSDETIEAGKKIVENMAEKRRLFTLANEIISTPEFRGSDVDVYSYSSGELHFAVVSEGAEIGVSETWVWKHLRTSNKLTEDDNYKTWIVCMKPDAWANYIDRDSYPKETIASGTNY
jgi:hypothetical protein